MRSTCGSSDDALELTVKDDGRGFSECTETSTGFGSTLMTSLGALPRWLLVMEIRKEHRCCRGSVTPLVKHVRGPQIQVGNHMRARHAS